MSVDCQPNSPCFLSTAPFAPPFPTWNSLSPLHPFNLTIPDEHNINPSVVLFLDIIQKSLLCFNYHFKLIQKYDFSPFNDFEIQMHLTIDGAEVINKGHGLCLGLCQHGHCYSSFHFFSRAVYLVKVNYHSKGLSRTTLYFTTKTQVIVCAESVETEQRAMNLILGKQVFQITVTCFIGPRKGNTHKQIKLGCFIIEIFAKDCQYMPSYSATGRTMTKSRKMVGFISTFARLLDMLFKFKVCTLFFSFLNGIYKSTCI